MNRITAHDQARTALLENHFSLAKDIITEYPDLAQSVDDQGYYLLHHACGVGALDVVHTLIDLGANPHALDPDGHPPIRWAQEFSHHSILTFYVAQNLQAPSLQFPYPLRSPLCIALTSGDIFATTCCLQLNFLGSTIDQIHDYPFVELCRLSRKKNWCSLEPILRKKHIFNLCDLMLHYGVPLDQTDSIGHTPIFYAAHYQSLDVLHWMQQQGVPLNSLNRYGESALFFSAREGHLQSVQWFLAHHPPASTILTTNTKRQTMIDVARLAGHTSIVSTLEDYLLQAHTRTDVPESVPKRL